MNKRNLARAVVISIILSGSAYAAPARDRVVERGTGETIVQKIARLGKIVIHSVFTVPHG